LKTCLLLTDRFEPTADLLVAEMRRRGAPCVRWNLDDFPNGSSLTYRASTDGFQAEIVSDGRRVDLDRVGSIWCRGVQALGFPPDLASADRKFAEAESERVLTALYTIAKAVWINHPHCHIRANAKPAQLAVTLSLGLDIPSTVITNDPDEVRAFVARSEGETIYKALTQSLDTAPGKALFTSLVTDKALAEIDLIRITPGVFQELVPKAYELRVTVVGSRVFSARIDSQSRRESKIDWRRLPFEADAAVDLPGEIEAKLHAFMKAFGLVYGAFDFIVTPEGRHVFLEVNPAGQYMWLESKLGLPITAALADALSDPCRNN
jgi:glutathione synthase/RimK-type ligase-like ATP-grasp enzyme